MVIPAQFKSDDPTGNSGTLRQFTEMSFRLYYSSNIQSYDADSTPALAAAPSISLVGASEAGGNALFEAHVTGDPSAGIQEVWVTYTALSGPFAGMWQSLDLTQSPANSTLWQGALALAGTPAQDLRYMVQASNGVGLVALSTNLGAYFTPGEEPGAAPPLAQPASLSLQSPPTSGAYSTRATFSAVLTSNGAPLAGKTVVFGLGSQRSLATTDSNGLASVDLPLLGLPGTDQVRVSFAGDRDYQSATTSSPFTISKQATSLELELPSAEQQKDGTILLAKLKDAQGRPLGQKTIFFVVSGNQSLTYAASVIGDFAGQASLGRPPLPAGSYTVSAYFGGAIPLPTGTISLDDERYDPAQGSLSLELGSSTLDCSTASPSVPSIWPDNKRFVPVSVAGVSDPEGDPLSIVITGIYQDERTGNDSNTPDGRGVGSSTAEVRAQRTGKGDGRVYHIYFSASDPLNNSCDGEVLVQVPHNQGGTAVDGGPLFNSTLTSDEEDGDD
jgi:hypothetical protein